MSIELERKGEQKIELTAYSEIKIRGMLGFGNNTTLLILAVCRSIFSLGPAI